MKINLIEDYEFLIKFASKLHKNQIRKFSNLEYIVHPLSVQKLLKDVYKIEDSNILSAAILHDTVEDCKSCTVELIFDLFNNEISNYVSELTKSSTLKETNERLLISSLGTKIIKLADILDNLSDLDKEGFDLKFANKFVTKKLEQMPYLKFVNNLNTNSRLSLTHQEIYKDVMNRLKYLCVYLSNKTLL